MSIWKVWGLVRILPCPGGLSEAQRQQNSVVMIWGGELPWVENALGLRTGHHTVWST